MTTSEQPSVLDEQELGALRALAQDPGAPVEAELLAALQAKGMLQSERELSPAGHHAIHVGRPGMVVGVDN